MRCYFFITTGVMRVLLTKTEDTWGNSFYYCHCLGRLLPSSSAQRNFSLHLSDSFDVELLLPLLQLPVIIRMCTCRLIFSVSMNRPLRLISCCCWCMRLGAGGVAHFTSITQFLTHP